MIIALNAAEAFSRYQVFLSEDRIIQREWNTEKDGRHLACALGVIGDEVTSPGQCPAQIMPRWLAQMVPWFFDGQSFDDAKAWGLKFYSELSRLNGVIPFSVVHDWQANVVGPLAIEVATKRNRNVAAHEALQTMQREALAGKKFTADEWRPVLRAAFRDAYAYADANANANANAYASAYAYADAYADVYSSYAYAYADVYADAYAYAYAYAYANAYAYAYANAMKRLADGMIECLTRVSG